SLFRREVFLLNIQAALSTCLACFAVFSQVFSQERYVGTGLGHSIPLVERLVKEYKEGFESRYIEYLTPL
ncbi:hypothetical protein BpHYR1_050706, partial [Brachionus plicatilis]